MDVVIIARNGIADRLAQMVRAAGSSATIYDRWNPEIEARIRTGGLGLIIMEPDLRTFERRLPKPSTTHRWTVAYLVPDVRQAPWEVDSPIEFLPKDFVARDIQTLLQTAAEVSEIPVISPWSLTAAPRDQSRMTLAVAAGISTLLAGSIAYRLPGLGEWTANTSTTPYYLVAGLTLFAAGCLLKLNRPATSGMQFAVIATLTALSMD